MALRSPQSVKLLPAYDLLAQEDQFDSPNTSSEHYTYVDNIRIKPSSGIDYEDKQPVTVYCDAHARL